MPMSDELRQSAERVTRIAKFNLGADGWEDILLSEAYVEHVAGRQMVGTFVYGRYVYAIFQESLPHSRDE